MRESWLQPMSSGAWVNLAQVKSKAAVRASCCGLGEASAPSSVNLICRPIVCVLISAHISNTMICHTSPTHSLALTHPLSLSPSLTLSLHYVVELQLVHTHKHVSWVLLHKPHQLSPCLPRHHHHWHGRSLIHRLKFFCQSELKILGNYQFLKIMPSLKCQPKNIEQPE